MRLLLLTTAAFSLAASAHAQSTGTVNLIDPLITPTAPQISPAAINSAVNAALTFKADLAGLNTATAKEKADVITLQQGVSSLKAQQAINATNITNLQQSLASSLTCTATTCSFMNASGQKLQFTVSTSAVTGTPELVADSTVAATMSDGSTFAWATSGQNSGTLSTSSGAVSLSQPVHPNTTNQSWIAAPLLSGAYCYTAQILNPASNSNYNAGLGLWNKTSGNSAIIEGLYSNSTGTAIIVNTQTNFQGAGSNTINAAYNQPYPSNGLFFERLCSDGNGNITLATSASGVVGSASWQTYTTTLAALGSPDHLGIYVDANPSGGQTYQGSLTVQTFAVTAGYTPTAAVSNPDLTQTFIPTTNFPTSDTLPTISGLTPDDGITLASGTTEVAGVIFGTSVSGANVTTNQQVLNMFWTQYAEGGSPFGNGALNTALGSPIDTGQNDNTTFASVARTYAANDPNSVHQVRSDGLYLLNNCSRNHTYCYPGQIYGGMISPSLSFKPGMTMEIRAQTGGGAHRWTPMWMFSFARQVTGSTFTPCDNNGNGPCYELDVPGDQFTRADGGTTPGQEVIPWTPQYGQYDGNITITTPAYRAYMANTNSFTDKQVNEEYEQINNFNCSTAYCDFFVDWEAAVAVSGVPHSHYIDVFVAPVTSPATPAKLISRIYMEYQPSNTGPGGTPLGEGIYLSAAQAIPGASLNGGNMPSYASISENDGTPSTTAGAIPGWGLKIQKFFVFGGDVVNPTSYEPTN